MKKYELTKEKFVVYGGVLHRIKALKDFGDVKAGDLGGWIEKEENLSHDGNAWVYDNAKVYKDALVCGNAAVRGNATVVGCAQIRDNAAVCDYAEIYHRVVVCDDAQVLSDTQISEDAKIFGSATIRGNAKVTDKAKVGGYAKVSGGAIICDNAHIAGGVSVFGGARILDDVELQDFVVVFGHTILFGNVKLSGNTRISNSDEACEAMRAAIRECSFSSQDSVLDTHAEEHKSSLEDTAVLLKRFEDRIRGKFADIEHTDLLRESAECTQDKTKPSSQDSTLEVSVKESDELKARLNRASLASVIRPFAEDSKTIIDNLLGASQQSGIFKASLAQYKEAADKLVYFCMGHSDECCTSQEYALLLAVINSLMLLSNEEDIVGKTSGANLGSDSPLLIRALRPVQKKINEYLAGDSIDADPVRESAKCTQDKAKKMSF